MSSDEWMKERYGLLTSSNFAAACGLNPYQSRLQLWKVLTGKVQIKENAHIRRGLDGEKAAISAYEAATGSITASGRTFRHERYQVAATPDALILDDSRPLRTVEVKCPKYPWDSPKKYYWPQVVGQIECSGAESGDLAAYCNNEIKVWRFSAPDAFMIMLPHLLSLLDAVERDEPPVNDVLDVAVFSAAVIFERIL